MFRSIRKDIIMGYDKRYSGECCFRSPKTIQKCVKLTEEEINIVKSLFPNKSLSYGIRTLIHYADVKEKKA